MKKILFAILILMSFQIFSQSYTIIEDLKFKQYKPKWIHLSIDSSYLQENVFNGTDQLFPILGLQLFFDQNYFYNVSGIFNNDILGYYIEKVDYTDGKKLWDNYVDVRNESKQFIPQNISIDNNGNISILSLRNILNGTIFPFGTKTHLSLQTYNPASGDLISNDYAADSDTLVKEFLYPFGDPKWYCRMDDSIVVIYQKQLRMDSGIPTLGYFKNVYDPSGNVLVKSEDTILMSINPDIKGAIKFGGSRYFRLQDNSFVLNSEAFSELNSDIWSTMEVLHIDKNWNLIKRINLSNFFSAPDDFQFYQINHDTLLLSNYQLNGENMQTKFITIDLDGNLIESVYLKNDIEINSKSIILTNNGNKILILGEISNILQFYKSDGSGILNNILELEFYDPKLDFLPLSLDIDDNNDLIVRGRLSRDTIINGKKRFVGNWNYIFCIDGKELGLKTNTYNLSEFIPIGVFPNPASDYITIACGEEGSKKIEIFDPIGRKVLKQNINECGETQIDISSLNSGLYMVILLDDIGKVSGTAKFVKE